MIPLRPDKFEKFPNSSACSVFVFSSVGVILLAVAVYSVMNQVGSNKQNLSISVDVDWLTEITIN